MFHPTTSKSGRILFYPLILLCKWMGKCFPVTLIRLRYFFTFRRCVDLKNPKDLNEKILWAKLYSDTSKWTELADKYKVRSYVESIGLKEILPKLYGLRYHIDEIDFASLPSSFIFKANNGDGTGTNLIVRDKDQMDEKQRKNILSTLDHWLKRKDIGILHVEPQYKDMVPCIIAEELLKQSDDAESLIDYKIWCIYGKAHYICVYYDRDAEGGKAYKLTYDLDWNAHPECTVFTSDYPQGKLLPKPQNLEEMIHIAEQLSAGFPEVRVDLYNINGKIYFGELTFTSQGGLMDSFSQEFLTELGSLINIKDFPPKRQKTK